MLHALVLGSAAGGGFPQWNCNDDVSRRVRAGDPWLRPRTQSSLAVSADRVHWIVLNASPDLRQQINERHQLQPSGIAPKRASPLSAIVLTNADVDHVAGLLCLRESQALCIYGHKRVLDVLGKNNIFNVLNPTFVARRPIALDVPIEVADRTGRPLGITIRTFPVPGKIALWLEDSGMPDFGSEPGDTIGLEVASQDSPSLFYIPGCSEMTPELAQRIQGAALVFFDGTLWRDDEMIMQGVGTKTGLRMGHMSCSGDQGTIAAFAPLNVGRKVFTHINNTNQLLIENSKERAEAESAGWEVAFDGMELTL